jgi:MSHA biogenesis protein MshO
MKPASFARYPRARGFTLIEAVVVILISGIIFAVVAIFIQKPIQGYFDTTRRAELSDIADTAVRRITRDLRLALPNSVRVSGNYLEFLLTTGGGRYRAEQTSAGAGNILDFNLPAGDSSFDVIGPVPPLAAGNQIVIFNLGTGFSGADAYQAAANNRAAFGSLAGNTVTLSAAKLFPWRSPGKRFHVVETPVTYECNVVSGVMRRYWGYTINAVQVVPPVGGSNALLATSVSGCNFTYNANELNQRFGIVSIRLELTQSGEAVTVQAQAHVPNIP